MSDITIANGVGLAFPLLVNVVLVSVWRGYNERCDCLLVRYPRLPMVALYVVPVGVSALFLPLFADMPFLDELSPGVSAVMTAAALCWGAGALHLVRTQTATAARVTPSMWASISVTAGSTVVVLLIVNIVLTLAPLVLT